MTRTHGSGGSPSPRLSRRGAAAIERSSRLIVPAIVCFEVLMIESMNRIRFDRPPLQWLRDALARPRTEVAEITPEIASQAVAFGRYDGRDPFDHLIAATAVALGAELASNDERIAALPGVTTVW